MYQWYVLIKEKLNSTSFINEGERLFLKADDSILTDTKLFWLGFLEALPTMLGITAMGYLKSFLFPFDYVLIGVIFSIIIAYILKDDVPDQPIHLNDVEKSKITKV
jgi:hypothetical protein